MREHRLSAEPTHSVWDRDLEPRLAIAPGDVVRMECVDASGLAGIGLGKVVAELDRVAAGGGLRVELLDVGVQLGLRRDSGVW